MMLHLIRSTLPLLGFVGAAHVGGDVLIGDAGLLHAMVLLTEEILTALTGVVAKM